MARHGRSFLFRAIVKNPFPAFAAGAGANAAGATVTLNASLIAGTATGAASAAAITVSLNTSELAGAATGAASAAAVTVTEQESLSTVGAATGAATRAGVTVTLNTSAVSGAATGAAVGGAATVTEAASLVTGAATGAASAGAATVTLNTSLIAGTKTGAASAAGATVSEALSLTAGAASGGGVGTASGATVTAQLSLVAARTFPNASTTGPRFSFTGTSGPITVSTNGAVVERLDFTGDIIIAANNVTVRDCRIQSFPFYGVRVADGFTGAIVEYCEIIGGDNGLAGADATFRYNNIHGNADGLKMWGNNVVEYNYIHDLGTGDPGEHNDGIQTTGGGPYTVRGNTVINQNAQTSCLLLGEEDGPITSTLVEGNYFAGGGYAIYSAAGATIRDNVIGTGSFSWATGTAPGGGWTNNIDAASGRYVAFDGTLGALAPTAGGATGAALATGRTVTEATSLIAGAASAGGAGNASGVTVSLATALLAGAATGAAARAGATVTEAASLIAGAASVGGAATASGATVTEAVSLIAGSASAGVVGAVAPPVRASFDQMGTRFDSTVVTFDQESTRVLPAAKFSLLRGSASSMIAAQGALVSETTSLIAGAAVASGAPVVAGKTLTTVTTLLAGAASSTEPVTVSGATLTLRASVIAGAASGGVATSPGITWDKTTPTWDATSVTFDATTGAGAPAAGLIGQTAYSFLAGSAIGASSAAGVVFQTRASFMASPANVGNQPATAQGRIFTAALSLVPGAVRGQGWSVVPETGPAWTNVAKPGDGWTIVPRPGGTWDEAA